MLEAPQVGGPRLGLHGNLVLRASGLAASMQAMQVRTAGSCCLECLSPADLVTHAVCRVPLRLLPLGLSCWSCTRTPCPGGLPGQFTC